MFVLRAEPFFNRYSVALTKLTSGYGFILQEDGRILFHRDVELRGKFISDLPESSDLTKINDLLKKTEGKILGYRALGQHMIVTSEIYMGNKRCILGISTTTSKLAQKTLSVIYILSGLLLVLGMIIFGLVFALIRLGQAKEAFRESEAQRQALLDGSPDMIMQIDTNMRILWANKAALDMNPDAMGQTCHKAYMNRDDICEGCPCKKCVHTGQIEMQIMYQAAVKGVQGESYWENIGVPIKDSVGRTVGAIEINRNVTERKLAEEALRESEERYKSLIHRIQAAVVVHDGDTKIIASNPKAQELLGLTEDQVLGKTAMDPDWKFIRADGERLPLEEYPVNQVVATQQPLRDLTFGVYRPDKSDVVWVLVNADPVLDDKGKIQQVIVTFMDITERKHTEEALRESEEKYRTIYNNAQVGLYRSRLSDGKMLMVNDRMSEMFGYERSEDCIADCVASEHYVDPGARERLLAIMREHGKFTNFEAQITRRDNSTFWAQYSGMLFPEKGYFEGVAIDITEHKQAEDKIKASLKEKEVLLREIHHRVKNNMQVIISLLSLQYDKIKDKQSLEMFKESQDRIRSMSLIHEKLYQSGDLANIAFSGYVKDLVTRLVGSYGVNPERIELKIEVEDVSIGLDNAIPCGLIINELVSNSLKYAFPQEGKGEIKIALRSVNEDELELTVSDNGIGIPEDLDFENPESLGLDLVKTLAEHNLDAKIELDRKEGITFRILFRMS